MPILPILRSLFGSGAIMLATACAGGPPPCAVPPPPPPPPNHCGCHGGMAGPGDRCSPPMPRMERSQADGDTADPMRGGAGEPRMQELGWTQGTPPPEAFAACTGKKPGDECVAKKDDWEMRGLCSVAPMGGPEVNLVCSAQHLSGPQPRNGNTKPPGARAKPKT